MTVFKYGLQDKYVLNLLSKGSLRVRTLTNKRWRAGCAERCPSGSRTGEKAEVISPEPYLLSLLVIGGSGSGEQPQAFILP